MIDSYGRGGDLKKASQLNFRILDAERGLLQDFAALTGRTQTDILRKLINSLKDKISEAHLYKKPFDPLN